MKIRTRIAPSPTGYPHIATVWQSLINYAFAKKNKGKFIVRIEDTDKERFVKGAEQKIFQALDWVNIQENESPRKKGPYSPYKQSKRLQIYQKYAHQLVEKGKAYYCFCSPERLDKIRKQKKLKEQIPMYDGRCRQIDPQKAKKRAQTEKFVIRLKVPKNKKIIVNDLIRGKIEFDSNIIDDQVLLKSDGFPTYHLAVVVDDHLMKITHMVRGEEWLSSAPKQVLVYDFFKWEKPVFIHTPILRNPDKSKLSKRQSHTNVSWFRKQGYLPEAILNFLALLGWSHPKEKTIFSLEEFIKEFDLKDLSAVGPVVDLEKLDWINSNYIKKTDKKKLLQLIKQYLKHSFDDQTLIKIIPLLRERITKLSEVNDLTAFFVKKTTYNPKILKKKGASEKELKNQLSEIEKQLSKVKKWSKDNIYQTVKKSFKKNNWDKKIFYPNLYLAVEGKTTGLPLFDSMEILGRKESLSRFQKATAKLN